MEILWEIYEIAQYFKLFKFLRFIFHVHNGFSVLVTVHSDARRAAHALPAAAKKKWQPKYRDWFGTLSVLSPAEPWPHTQHTLTYNSNFDAQYTNAQIRLNRGARRTGPLQCTHRRMEKTGEYTFRTTRERKTGGLILATCRAQLYHSKFIRQASGGAKECASQCPCADEIISVRGGRGGYVE